MSLILEALKKLDREKQAPERGFVVVASQPWPAPTRGRGRAVALVFLGLVSVAGVILLARPKASPRADRTPPPTLAASPTPAARPPAPSLAVAAPVVSSTPRPAAPQSVAPALPAASPHTAPASPPTLVLQAISERDGSPIALVSDRLVREGDEFDGVRVVRIGDAEVEIEWRGQRSVLRF